MKKVSIHFGINEYDKKYYGKTPNLNGCVNDASAMAHFCKLNKFTTINAFNWECTKERLGKELSNAAVNIKSFALKNIFSGEHRVKNQDELLTLVKVLTPEAQPIAYGVDG